MEIISLKISNIASFEDATIRFDETPLKNNSLFLICGATGTGKTTILDAICLALFNKTPRTSNYSGNEKFAPVNSEQEITLKDERQLLRRGKKEGFVELMFQGNDSNTYTARWEVSVNRNHKLRNKSWSVRNEYTKEVYEKDAEISEVVKHAIGCDFKNFKMTTLLAQGDFAQFLTSDDDTKASILETLTGKDIFRKIGVKIYDITNEKNERKKILFENLQTFTLLTDEEKEELSNELTNISANLISLSEERLRLSTKLEWQKNKNTLTTLLKQTTDELSVFAQKIQGEEYTKEKTLLEQWKVSVVAVEWNKQIQRLRKELHASKQKSEELKTKFSTMCEGINGIQEEIKAIRNEHESLKKALSLYSTEERQMIERTDQITFLLESAFSDKSKVEKGRKQIPAIDKSLNDLNNQFNKLKEEHEITTQQTTELEAKLKDVASEIVKLDPGNSLNKEYNNISNCNEAVEKILAQKISIETLNSEIASAQKNIDYDLKILNETTPYIEKAKYEWEQAEEKYEIARNAVSDFAQEMRKRLKVGDDCPVCGRRIKTLFDDEHFQSVLEIPEQLRSEKRAALQKLQLEFAGREKQIELLKKQLAKLKANLGLEESECRKQSEIILSLSFNINSENLKDSSSIKKTSEVLTRKKEKLFKEMERLNVLQKQKDELLKQKETLRQKELIAKEAITNQSIEIEKLKSEKKNLLDLCENFSKSEREKIQRLKQLIVTAGWETMYEEDVDDLKKSLCDNANRYKGIVEKEAQYALTIEKMHSEFENLLKHKASIEELTEWRFTTQGSRTMERLYEAAQKLHTDIVAWHANNATIERQTKDISTMMKDFYESHEDINAEIIESISNFTAETIQDLQTAHEKVEKEFESLTNKARTIQEQIANTESNAPAFTEEEKSMDYLTKKIEDLDKQKGLAEQSRGAINQKLEDDEKKSSKVAALKTEYETAQKEFDRWSRLNNALGSSDGAKFKRIALSYIFEILLSHANHYLAQFDENFELAKNNLYTIIIKDYRNNGILSSTGLSGGQQFMVSLSLALGLSDMANNGRNSSNILFIDEGFGTLSEDYLSKVMDCLEKLQKKTGKKIGIISHVERLRERIPTQIFLKSGNASAPTAIEIKS